MRVRAHPRALVHTVVFGDAVRAELQADAADAYNRVLKWWLLPVFGAYFLAVIFNSSWTSDAQHVTRTHPNGIRYTAAIATHHARESGLRMQVSPDAFPHTCLSGHAIAASTLFLLVFLQKETVRRLARAPARDAGRRGKDQWQAEVQLMRVVHKWAGMACLALLLAMDCLGFYVGRHSAWGGFTLFNFAFFAPWVIMFLGIYGTARSPRLIRWHRFFGNMLLKSCIATPLARLAGAALQHRGWTDEMGYYQGIGGVTLGISVWQVADLVDVLG